MQRSLPRVSTHLCPDRSVRSSRHLLVHTNSLPRQITHEDHGVRHGLAVLKRKTLLDPDVAPI